MARETKPKELPTSIRIPTKLLKEFDRVAKLAHRTRAEHLRFLIEQTVQSTYQQEGWTR